MAIGAIPSATEAGATPARSLGLQDFLRILLTQLQYQDPLKPMDNQEFMAQMAQFTSLQQAQRVNDRLDLLIANQSALQSIGLIGRTVDVSTAGGNVTGTVASLSLKGDVPVVTVNTSAGASLPDISLTQILAVR